MAAAAVATAAPASGLLAAAESAPLVVVARVSEPERLDRRGWGAWLQVERVLFAGPAPDAADGASGAGTADGASGAGTTEGDRLRLGWEQLAAGASPLLADGERILAALEPMPEWSLWRSRFPEGRVWLLAARSTAYLAEPDAATVAALEDHLALPPAARAASPGDASRARLVAEAEPGLAVDALEALAEAGARDRELTEGAAAALAGALADASRPEPLRRALLELAATRRLDALREEVSRLASPGHPLEAPALDALFAIGGAPDPARVRALIARDEAPVRAVALRRGGATLGLDELAAFVRDDPAPEVRIAATAALTSRRAPAALEAASAALFDDVPVVRAAAAERLGELGATAVPLLRALALSHGPPDAAAPIAALQRAGAAGREALVEIAETHPDESVRRLAGVALGRPLEAH